MFLKFGLLNFLAWAAAYQDSPAIGQLRGSLVVDKTVEAASNVKTQPDGSSIIWKLAIMAQHVYLDEMASPEGWEVLKTFKAKMSSVTWNGQERVAIWKHKEKSQCVMAFQGTEHLGHVWTNLTTSRSRRWCGYENIVHRGFAQYLEALWAKPRFKQMVKTMRSAACSEGIAVVGHSLGGALAELVTACARSGKKGKKHIGFKPDYVFSFGAPQISQVQALDLNGAKGGRYYNQDHAKGYMDPVPALGNTIARQTPFHPVLDAFCLTAGAEPGKFLAIETAAVVATALPTEEVIGLPSSWQVLQMLVTQEHRCQDGQICGSSTLHLMGTYSDRLAKICPGSAWCENDLP